MTGQHGTAGASGCKKRLADVLATLEAVARARCEDGRWRGGVKAFDRKPKRSGY